MAARHETEENVVEIRTMSGEECVQDWAIKHQISPDAISKLIKEGFDSMAAIQLIDADDLAKTKISRGQQKLILASVNLLKNKRTLIQEEAVSRQSVEVQTANQHHNTTQFLSRSENLDQQQGSDRDPYVQALFRQSHQGQSQTCATVTNNVLSDLNIGNSIQNANSSLTGTHSWQDPQVYLSAAASGKSALSYYDITEFVAEKYEEEIVVGDNGSQRLVLKSGPQKPRLESVTLAQWSVANLAILYKLLGDARLNAGNILDYLSYTTKICQLVQKYSLVSVLLYDREYRKLQATHNFRWGTDIPHLQTVHLQPRIPQIRSSQNQVRATAHPPKPKGQAAPVTLDGREICKLFNTQQGCHFQECKFVHQCSLLGCHQQHSAVTHSAVKN